MTPAEFLILIKPSIRQILFVPTLLILYLLLCSQVKGYVWSLLFLLCLLTSLYNFLFNFLYAKQKIIDPSRCSILITGCSSGFGYASALHLIKQGFTVLATVRREEDAKLLLDSVTSKSKLHTLIMDVTDASSIEETFKLTQQKIENKTIPPLFALVNNSGIPVHSPIELVNMDDVKKAFDVNVFGIIRMVQAFLPLLRDAAKVLPDARIVNISSMVRLIFKQ